MLSKLNRNENDAFFLHLHTCLVLAPVCKMVSSFASVSTCEASSHLALYALIKLDKRHNHLEGSHCHTVQGDVDMVGENPV